ncbi:MAG: Gfo/Idh/MocA family oxidoreductase [Bryobacter sp.]|nr:Gfo/Idh/MocA family oxidoreductase [Bryobacter sp.]
MMTNRRDVLLSLAAVSASGATKIPSTEKVRVALVGLRGRGRDLEKCLVDLHAENVELAAMVDVDANLLAARAAAYQQKTGRTVATHSDLRRVLDDKNIHAVALCTPNHWHALGTVWACQADKDVYLEKPGSQTFREGEIIARAAAKYGRVVQHGTQNRSSENIVEAMRQLKAGVIGRVYMARGVAFKTRSSFGKMTQDPLPAGLDWDQWLGPARKVPYSKKIQGSSGNGWHLLWDYGNGEIGNQGVHEMDIMRWGLGLDALPSKVYSTGGKFVHPTDEQDAPQVQSTTFEYAGRDVLLTFETRGGLTNTEAGMGAEYPFLDKQNVVGVIFLGTDGYMIIPDYTSFYTFLGRKREKGPHAVGDGSINTLPHVRNFIAAVRAGSPAGLNAPPIELHRSCAMAHFANLAYRTGSLLQYNEAAHEFSGSPEATRLLTREYRAPYAMPKEVLA